MKKRIFYYDNIKGLLTICVLLMHTLSLSAKYYNYDNSIFKIISFFIMPVFIFVMGFFAYKSKRTPLKRCKKMFLIYLISQIIITIYYAYILKIINNYNLFIPRFTLWYLLSGSILYLSEYLFRKYPFKKVFIISLIISLISGFIPFITNFLSMTRTLCLLPFFVMGYYQEQINLFDFIKKYQKIIYLLVFIITIWFLFNQGYFSYKDTYLKYNYYAYSNILTCFKKRCLLYIIFLIFSAFILLIVPKKKTLLSTIGNKSLPIYLIHGVMLKTIFHYGLYIDNKIIGTILNYILVFIISIIISIIFVSYKKFNKINYVMEKCDENG